MRLSCPNCAAIYELSEDRLTPGGSHVQCSDCHTRWFARPPALAAPSPAPLQAVERPSEDEIIARLETRSAARGTAAPAPAASSFSEPIAFPGPTRPRPAEPPTAEPQTARPPSAAAPVAPAPATPAPPTQAPPTPAAAPTPLRPRSDRPAPRPNAPEPGRPQPGARGQGRLGFALALALALLGLGLYLGSEGLAAQAPAAAPALRSYAAGIDAARDWIEAALGPLRPQAAPDA
jgi:predicted Zn finger-like uncharacterized protein